MQQRCFRRWKPAFGAKDSLDSAPPRLALSEVHLRTVRAILQGNLPGPELWVFGSRATGHARPFSDLDLLVSKPVSLTWLQRADLRDAFESSELPFKVDGVEVSGLSGAIEARVKAERVPLGLT